MTGYEVLREMLKQDAALVAFAGPHIYWFDVPAGVFQGRGVGKGCIAYRLVSGSPGELATCGLVDIQSATFEVYAWSTDGCSSQVAAAAISKLLGHSGTYLGVKAFVMGAAFTQDAKIDDAYGCGVSLEVHFSPA